MRTKSRKKIMITAPQSRLEHVVKGLTDQSITRGTPYIETNEMGFIKNKQCRIQFLNFLTEIFLSEKARKAKMMADKEMKYSVEPAQTCAVGWARGSNGGEIIKWGHKYSVLHRHLHAARHKAFLHAGL